MIVRSIILCVVILLCAVGAIFLIFNSEPEAQRTGATRTSSMLVETVTVTRADFQPELVVLGAVEAARDVVLRPQVGGRVLSLADAFLPGGRIQKGDTLVAIDPADYQIARDRAHSDLRQSEAELALEQGRQAVARRDFEAVGESLAGADRSLVLREPQMQMAQARVEAARAALRRSELDMDRTQVKAPFDAQVLTREIDPGSLASPGEPLGRIVGVDTYWVYARVPLRQVDRLAYAGNSGNAGSRVRLRQRSAWPEGVYREGRVSRLIGSLEGETRLARVLVVVPDPLALQPANRGKPALILDSLVEARILGEPLEDVVRLSRRFVRQNDTVWVKAGENLEVREVSVVFRDATDAYIADGLETGDAVITTNLSTVVDGAPVRTQAEPVGPAAVDDR
ncbi:MAG: efflux RND transporter periplasmic adaptor subunit [Opitutales bacterium]